MPKIYSEEEKKQMEQKTEQMKGFLTFVQESLKDLVQEVKLSGDLGSIPVCVTPASGMSFEMEKYFKRVKPDMDYKSEKILELNPDHEAVQTLLQTMTADPVLAKDYAQLLYAQALLMAQLPLEDPVAYTELVCRLMK